MDDASTSAVIRAFELAKSGRYSTVGDIKTRLLEEGFAVHQVAGYYLTKQLSAFIAAAQKRERANRPQFDAGSPISSASVTVKT